MAKRNDTNDRRRAPARGGARPAPALDGVTRSCVGCGARALEADLVRLVLVEKPEGVEGPCTVVPDAKGGGFGRGAHVHPAVDCVATACKRGLSRSFKREVRADEAELARSISIAFTRRLEGLLLGGVRGGHVAIGTDAVAESVVAGKAEVIVLAADATAAAQRSAVQRMTAAGKTLVFGDKLRLARALLKAHTVAEGSERDGVAVCSVTNVALASAVRRAWLCAVGLSSTAIAGSSPGKLGDASRSPSEAEA
ncbi:MAG: YlxR family protein [Polyangiales bacterium]